MHTILGATGQIAIELARELRRTYGPELTLVSRHPKRVNESDALRSADLLDAQQTMQAIQGSRVVYFTAGLPPDSALWEAQFPRMLKNALDATRATGARFVYFDNTYMYPQDARPQTEGTEFAPVGRKGRVRAGMASMVLEEMARGQIPVLIGRAPEFYGPGKTQSVTNVLVIDRLKAGKTPRVPLRDDTLRSLIWTPDASCALAALANAEDCYGSTWHLPCCDQRLNYREFVTLACTAFGRPQAYRVLGSWALNLASLVSKRVREIRELMPRYRQDNLFDSSRFKRRFPQFDVTSYPRGIELIAQEAASGQAPRGGPERHEGDGP